MLSLCWQAFCLLGINPISNSWGALTNKRIVFGVHDLKFEVAYSSKKMANFQTMGYNIPNSREFRTFQNRRFLNKGEPKMITLSPDFEASLSQRDRQLLSLIRRWDLEVLKQYLYKYNPIPEYEVDSAITEFQKFMLMVQLGFDNLIMTSQQVNEIWEALTSEVAKPDYWRHAFGSFVHYIPSEHWGSRHRQLADRFYQLYQKVFDTQIPIVWWPTH